MCKHKLLNYLQQRARWKVILKNKIQAESNVVLRLKKF